MKNDSILIANDLEIGYFRPKGPDFSVLKNLQLEVNKGEVVCVLGPNGSGKSTLLRTLSGIQPALSGWIRVNGQKVDVNQHKTIAHLLSVVLTDRVDVKNLTVYELVSMGRYPYTDWLGRLNNKDRKKVITALEQVHLLDYASRYVQELSDGELQRTMIAKALVQDTPLILLDEPTAHLDLPNRIETMQLLRKLAKETNKAILLSTHDLDLALQTADLLWLIRKSGPIQVGLPEDLVLNGSFEATFKSDNVRFDQESGTYRIQYSAGVPIRSVGNSITGFWTKRALQREGFLLDPKVESAYTVTMNEQQPKWQLTGPQKNQSYKSLASLIRDLKSLLLF